MIRLIRERHVVEQMSWLEQKAAIETYELPPSTKEGSNVAEELKAVSRTGRFLVYTAASRFGLRLDCYLVDTHVKESQSLETHIPNGATSYDYACFYFFGDEEKSLVKLVAPGTEV